MKLPTMAELMKLTRTELCALENRIIIRLSKHPEGSPERGTAVRNLHKVRRVIAWYDLAPE
jgi:hypothetical protein